MSKSWLKNAIKMAKEYRKKSLRKDPTQDYIFVDGVAIPRERVIARIERQWRGKLLKNRSIILGDKMYGIGPRNERVLRELAEEHRNAEFKLGI